MTAGTIGVVVKDAQGRQGILSNNHVLAARDRASKRDSILQPGWAAVGEVSSVALSAEGSFTIALSPGAVSMMARPGSSGASTGSTLEPGQHARESIPARGAGRDFTVAEREAVNEIGRKHGCHTCGTRNPGTKSGDFIPDHQPPSQLAPGQPQRLFPHCKACSLRQGGEVNAELRRK